MDRNKIQSRDKIQNGGDRKMNTDVLSRDSTLAIGILGFIGCFVALFGTVAVSIASAKSQNAYCFSL